MSAVNYKPPLDRTTQQERHATVQNKDTERLTHDWRNKIDISEKYDEYQNSFVDMLSQFQHLWDGHLGRIATAKHRIELIDPTTLPVHSVPYRACPKTREFEKLEVAKMLNDNIIETPQTE